MWTSNCINRLARNLLLALSVVLATLTHAQDLDDPNADQKLSVSAGAEFPEPAVGDVIFIRVSAKPFREVAAATNSWTNHVGIILAIDGKEPLIGESTFPFSRTTTLSKFIARSQNERYAIARLKTGLSSDERHRVVVAAQRRMGVFYDTGFDLNSHRQFCSRYVREVLADATGVNVGEVQTFADLLKQQPSTAQYPKKLLDKFSH